MKLLHWRGQLGGAAKAHARWLISLCICALALALAQTSFGRFLENRAFDVLTVATLPKAQVIPIFVVGIDEVSLSTIDQRWPWPRRIHAQLIDALTTAGAGAIVFDIMFDRPSDAGDDAALAAAIQRAGNVVLGAGMAVGDSEYGSLRRRQEPLPMFVAAGAAVGKVTVEMDDDRVVRRIPEAPDALWRVALQMVQRRLPDLEADFLSAKGSYLRYLGPSRTFSYLSYVKALELAKQPGALDGAIVLVGRMSAAASDITTTQPDTLQTPLTWTNGEVMPGVEVHATAIENAVQRQAIAPAQPITHWLLTALLALGCAFSLARQGLRAATVIALVWLVVVGALTFALWHFQQTFLPPIILMLLPLGTLLGRIVMVSRQEHQSRQALKRSFSLYLSAAVVDEIALHPERLALGGEQREITLLFTDLEGFTTLAEKLNPQQIARLLNEYFELMTQAVFQQEGTLDKFIGDAVMAFWGAPVAHADDPVRALRCARDMLAALKAFNATLAERGESPLKMRIGIHTGQAVVGNLGCPSRFSYTALGDTVNVAARLEAANKDYGTSILMSRATALCLPSDMPTRFVAKAQVKGRSEPLELFTIDSLPLK